ncbi:MAG: hypothetical protein MJ239_01135 [Bacilli bacterium]|nr:hypothetical protein [Bacilli bacterium]
MKKNLMILPLIAFALASCGGAGTSSGGIHISGEPSEPTSQPTSVPETEGDGLSIATAFTVAQALAKMKAAGDGKIVDNKEYYVKGTFDAGTTVNSQYHQWYGNVGEFKVSGATNDSGVSVAEADGGLDGRSFVVKGYMEQFNGEYKVGYLPASASPTGSKYIPSIVSLGGQGGGTSSQPTSTPVTSTPSVTSEGEGDGLSIATAFTTSQAIAKMKAAGNGKIVDNKEYYVKGTFDAGTTVNAQYHEFYGSVGEFKVSGATNESGVKVTETDGALDGYSFVVKGYMELFEGEYKVGFLPASVSPTGQKYKPSLVSLNGQGGDTSSQPTSTITPSVPTGDAWVVYNFSSLKRKTGSGSNGRLSNSELQDAFNASASATGKVTVTGENVYQGFVPSSGDTSEYKDGVDGCLRTGGSSKTGVITMTLSEAVTGVTISARSWSKGEKIDKINVNGAGETAMNYGAYADVVFNFASTKTVTITTTNRAFIQNIRFFK